MRVISKSTEQTLAIAAKIGKGVKGGDVLALSGDLGSGKTVFVKGLAKALGINCVSSPTFVLMHVHKTEKHRNRETEEQKNRETKKQKKLKSKISPCGGSPEGRQKLKSKIYNIKSNNQQLPTTNQQPKTLCHIDAYRLKDGNSLLEIGADEYIGNPKVITVIEWAEKVKKILPKNTKWIFFKHYPKKESWRIIKYKYS